MLMRLFSFTPAAYTEQIVHAVTECLDAWRSEQVTWIDIDGLHNLEVVRQCAELCGLHPLVVEDILHTDQRPKLDEHDEYLYLVVKMLRYDVATDSIDSEQLSIVLTHHGVMTFQEKPGDVLDPIRERIRRNKGRVRQAGADYLAYAIVDAVVDHYFVILEQISNHLERLEDDMMRAPTRDALAQIHNLRYELVTVRRAIWPLRDVLLQLERNWPALLHESTRPYIRDLYDHSVRVIENVEAERDLLTSLQELSLSNAGLKLNEVMKILTIISTIFIPLTFIVGIYGMNFDVMPELRWYYGYPTVMALMVALAVGMFWSFRKRGWFT